MSVDSKYVDQFHTPDGWHYTEDVSFFVTTSLTIGTPGVLTKVPVVFPVPPFQSFNRVPDARAAFLVLRKLDIGNQNVLSFRSPLWQWCAAIDTTYAVAANATNATTIITYQAGIPAPSASANIPAPVALRRIRIGTLPAGVTISRVQVLPGWSVGQPDDLHVTVASNTIIDLATYYDQNYGLVNCLGVPFTSAPTINVTFTTSNSNASIQNVPYTLYGLQQGYQWGQWLIQYQPPNGFPYDIGQYDDSQEPTKSFQLDKLIPIGINDLGTVDLGNLFFTANQQLAFYSTVSTYDIMLTATLAYLVPER